MKKGKVAKSGNIHIARAMQELRRSSASSPHVLKKYKGSRHEKKAKAIKEQL